MFTIYDDWVLVYKGTTFGINNAVVLEFDQHYAIKAFENVRKGYADLDQSVKKVKNLLAYYANNTFVVSDSIKYEICELCEFRFKHFTGGCNPDRYCTWKGSDSEVFLGDLELDIKGIYLPTNFIIPSARRFSLRDAVWNLGSYSNLLLKQMKGKPFETNPTIDSLLNKVHCGSRWNSGIPYINSYFTRENNTLNCLDVDPWNGRIDYSDNWRHSRPTNKVSKEMLAYLITKYKITKGVNGKIVDVEIPGLGSLISITWNESYVDKGITIPTIMVNFKRDGLVFEERFSHSDIQTRI